MQQLREELHAALDNSVSFNENDFNKNFCLDYMYAYRRKDLENSHFDVEIVWQRMGTHDGMTQTFASWHSYSRLCFLPQFIYAAQCAGFDLETIARNVTNKSVYPVKSDLLCTEIRDSYQRLRDEVHAALKCPDMNMNRLDNYFEILKLHLYRVKNVLEGRHLEVCIEWRNLECRTRFMCWHNYEDVYQLPAFVERANMLGFNAQTILQNAPNDSVYNIVTDPLCHTDTPLEDSSN